MVPAVPDGAAPPAQVVQYIMHAKGLPRLGRERREAFLTEQMTRLIEDERFRERFAMEYRVSSPDQQKAFREHLFDAFKPIVMDDIRGYHETSPELRQDYLDQRIVEYNRMAKMLSNVEVDPEIAGPQDGNRTEMLALLLQKTTEQERELGLAYAAALRARVLEILADPALKAGFEARIAQPAPN